jgi:hypothetical protein
MWPSSGLIYVHSYCTGTFHFTVLFNNNDDDDDDDNNNNAKFSG